MVFDDQLWRGRALSIAIVMTALAIMLLAGGVPYRSPRRPCFAPHGRFGYTAP